MLAGWVLFTDHALKWSPGTIKLVAIVSHPATLQYIREGCTNLLLAQQVYEWGVRPVDLLFDAVENGSTRTRGLSKSRSCLSPKRT